MKLIEEYPGLEAAIRSTVAEAFGGDLEARLVDALRREDALVLSLAAECAGAICGYAALSLLQSPPRALALAPVAVRKAMQGKGIGSALIRHAINRAQALRYDIVFVLGAPAYYERFGFSAVAAAPFPSPYTGPHFMALRLASGLIPPAPVIYPGAFDMFA
jgi:putative acetyltransferase